MVSPNASNPEPDPTNPPSESSSSAVSSIELLVRCGILTQVKISDNASRWDSSPNWDKKRVVLCVDGLSLDRHKSFQKKLANIKTSFTNNFLQAIVFEEALDRVIEINGPLHVAFHMLQTIYIIFKPMLQWGQK